MKMLAKIALSMWCLTIGGIFLYLLITKTEAVLFAFVAIAIGLFLVFTPFWALDELSKR